MKTTIGLIGTDPANIGAPPVTGDDEVNLESPLIDVGSHSVLELLDLPSPVLREALREVVEQCSAESEPYAGFDSAI